MRGKQQQHVLQWVLQCLLQRTGGISGGVSGRQQHVLPGTVAVLWPYVHVDGQAGGQSMGQQGQQAGWQRQSQEQVEVEGGWVSRCT